MRQNPGESKNPPAFKGVGELCLFWFRNRWVRGAEDSFSNFQGEPCDWLKLQIAEHGDSHRLSGPHESETLKGDDPIDPLPSVKEMTEAEGLQAIIDQSKQCQLDWSDVNDINTKTWEEVDKLMRLSVRGEESSVEMLRNLAVGITRHLLTHHADSMQFCHEFPIVVVAGTQKRKRQLEVVESLPIGVKINAFREMNSQK